MISVSNSVCRMDVILLKSIRGENLFPGLMHTYCLGGLSVNGTSFPRMMELFAILQERFGQAQMGKKKDSMKIQL